MLGKQLKQCRKTKSLTQQNVAKLLNMTTNAYQKYELGTVEPNIGKLIKLADIFDVSVDYLLGREQKSEKSIITFSDRLKELRNTKGVTQKTIAEYLGIVEGVYQDYECGNLEPNHEKTIKIADYFGVSVDYLLGRDDY